MTRHMKKIIIFDLWETLIFGTISSTISDFCEKLFGADIEETILKKFMLINYPNPRLFLNDIFEKIDSVSGGLEISRQLKIRDGRLYNRFLSAIKEEFKVIRWAPGAIELLELLQEEYELFLVSNLWAYQKKYLLPKLEVNNFFKRSLFSCDLGLFKDDILKGFTKFTGCSKVNAVFVGRSYEYDIIPAVNAGLSSIKIPEEFNVIFPDKIKKLIDDDFLHYDSSPENLTQKKAIKKKGKTIIIIPPFFRLLGSHNNRLNLMACELSSQLSRVGFDNFIFHADSQPHENYISRYKMALNSTKFYDLLNDERYFSDLENYLSSNGFDNFIITCGDILNPSFDSGCWQSAKRVAKMVRGINPKGFLVAIGPEVGIEAEDFDTIIYGEPDGIIKDVLDDSIRGKVTGVLSEESSFVSAPIFNLKKVVTRLSHTSLDTIIWRRGCSGTCDFCRVAEINKGKIRYRPIDFVMQEISLRHKQLKVNNFYIVDANFTYPKLRALEFTNLIKQEFPGITWRTESRFDSLDEGLLYEMRRAGCTHLKLGLENTLDERFQVKTKRVSMDIAVQGIRKVQKAGMKCVIYLMLGGRWFTAEQYAQMYKNAVKLNADGYTVSFFNPYPNTPAGISYSEWQQRGFIGSHLDLRLVDYWRIPRDIVEAFFKLELEKGREDSRLRSFN